ncbi:phosphoribosyltransferase family protein [Streptomyces sp. NPDC102406]|uniref:phosphoribosyltransferase family protein n=1 Tax=Streptomyces sp. NPDC102406 TaxID=3366171 RepID=UPI0037F56CC0
MRFDDRRAAGRRLARHLRFLRGRHVVVLGLSRGGVPVAYEVAQDLGAPLNVLVVRGLGVPFQPELGFGAISESGVRVLDEDVIRRTGLADATRTAVEQTERAELERQVRRYRATRAPVPMAGRTVVIVDDGLSTGAGAEAACAAARSQGAAGIVLAAPVAPASVVERLRPGVDHLYCLQTVHGPGSVGSWYDDFGQVSDAEVLALLGQSARPGSAAPPSGAFDPVHPGRAITVPAAGTRLAAHLAVPDTATAVAVFALAGNGGRNSPRNRYIAATLHRSGIGTLLLDLLTEEEESRHSAVLDIALLSRRLHAASLWLRHEVALPVAYFGAETGATAALEAASVPGSDVLAVVARSGRPELASPSKLARVRAPVLFIVGGQDPEALDTGRRATDVLRGECGLAMVPGASHPFTEPGALSAAAELARDWFAGHVARPVLVALPRRAAPARSQARERPGKPSVRPAPSWG